MCKRVDCGMEFTVKRPSDKKEYCSKSCAAIVNNLAIPKRKKFPRSTKVPSGYCYYCKTPITNLRNNIYCSKTCSDMDRSNSASISHEALLEHKINQWKLGLWDGSLASGDISKTIRNYIRKKYNEACVVCGWREVNPKSGKIPTEIEHIDGNHQNNKEENLTLLCPNHHSLTPTYRALNKGNGRKNRLSVDQYVKRDVIKLQL